MVRPDPELQALHLQALREGRASLAVREGDAEGMLWDAPRALVVQRVLRFGGAEPLLRSELHALLGPDGRPLAWWQRSAAAAWPAGPSPVPSVAAHCSVHRIALDPGAAPVDAALVERCALLFTSQLAAVAGCEPMTYLRACWPERAAPRPFVALGRRHAVRRATPTAARAEPAGALLTPR